MNRFRRIAALVLCMVLLAMPYGTLAEELQAEAVPAPASAAVPEEAPQSEDPTEAPEPAPTEEPLPTEEPQPTPEPVTPSPEPTTEPTAVPTPEPTEEPEPTDVPDIPEMQTELTAGTPLLYLDGKLVSLNTQLSVGTTVTIAVPFVYTASGDGTRISYASNRKEGRSVTWKPSSVLEDFDQETEDEESFLYHVTHLEVYPAGDVPFIWNQNEPAYVVAQVNQGNIDALSAMGTPVIGETVNMGYAVFRDVVLRKDMSTGYHPLTFDVIWFDIENGNQLQRVDLEAGALNVKAKSSGGGYGGGGGRPETTPMPKTQLLVESISTAPKTVNAGEEFDLTLNLNNTSKVQKAQNIRLTVSAEGDAVLPTDGSSTLYIENIDPEQKAQATIHMKAKTDVSGDPIKLDVNMEFEDSTLTQQSASQTLILNVYQVQRIRLDMPAVPAGERYPGDEDSVTMGIYNTGHTVLYNVTAELVSADGNLVAAQSYYAGNMESGASKTAELNITVMNAGTFDGEILVTYEDALGNPTTERRQFTMSAAEMPNYDDYYGDYEPPEDVPVVEERSPVAEILESPTYMLIIGAAAMAILCLTIGLILRRRKAKELDEDF